MKKKPTVINSFEQLNEVLISPTVKQDPTGAINKPESVQLFIREVSIKESLQRLVDLYIQSPYVMLMGEQWIEAFDDAVTALNYEI